MSIISSYFIGFVRLLKIRIAPSLVAVLAACAAARASDAANDPHLSVIENGMPSIAVSGADPLKLTFSEWMNALAIPGVTVAVIDDYKVVWVRGFGVADASTREPVTPDTLFQAGSIAKPLAAMAALRMVERGQLALDGDINASLKIWRLQDNEFTAKEKVTLRRLLSHTSGVTPGGFEGYVPGAALPSIQQILDGAPPANSPAARVIATPGTTRANSGLAYTIVQLALTEIANKPFADLMRDSVLAPLNMQNSTFEQPVPARFSGRVASGHGLGGLVIGGRWRVHPEMAAAGLWTTPSDLAQAAIEMAKAQRGESKRVLSKAMAQRMLTEERESSTLGWMLESGGGMFWHNGGTEGYRAQLRMYAETGDGVVVLSNSDNGFDATPVLVNAVAADRKWQNFSPRSILPIVTAKLVASRLGVARGLGEYRTMRSRQPPTLFGPGDLNGWGYMLLEQKRVEDAISVFTDNVGYYPDNAYAHDALGEALLAAGRHKEAAASYRRSLELDPANENARQALSRIEGGAL